MLILTISAGVLIFGISLGIGWLMSENDDTDIDRTAQQTKTEPDSNQTEPELVDASESTTDEFSRNISERELKRLLVETRDTLKEYKQKINNLEKKQTRINTIRKIVEKDLRELDELRSELTQASSEMKSKISRLEKLKVEIDESKRDNLVALASTYDTMDSSSASNILANMARLPGEDEKSINDAIKILYFMSDRTRGKLLEKLSENEPELAAVFCNKLKFITETN